MKRVLTIAGSDSGGGAGVQTDIRTFSLLGCHGASAITAITAQNSMGVEAIYPVEPEGVAAQVTAVLSDIGADAAKTGMLFSEEIIKAVAGALDKYPVERLVVDPVMVAKGGAPLLKDEARAALIKLILPKAYLATPNIPEAESITGIKIVDEDSALRAARAILDLGAGAVLLKGGHAEGELVTDLLLTDRGEERRFVTTRVATKNTHGTGCTLSAAIAAYLAKGLDLAEAVRAAHSFLARAIASSYDLGAGHGPTNPYAAAMGGSDRALLERLHKGWELLEEINPWGLIPEVQSNLAEAHEGAESFNDVAAFPGRITKAGERVRHTEGPRFGGSRHMAKILLASQRHASPFRAVMNIRYGADVLAACKELGLSIDSFSRDDEPLEVKEAEGSTLEWGTGSVLARGGEAPRVIFDEGDRGKEPMIRVFGVDAVEVVKIVGDIWNKLREKLK
ncbi:MAG: bifunctional hydroxymethylpyrimidine kinase/phosphomethylpyrimidine kinase [Deltaproteobacteria bacterium]|nr:MAG: bifunctional hydroxymethylpyrimidine kinase/phosphomethylpyrimidine kinase [Deltaproteobacteria bacterium]